MGEPSGVATLSTLRDWMGGSDRRILDPDIHESIFGGSDFDEKLAEIVGGIDWNELANSDDEPDIEPVDGVDIGLLFEEDKSGGSEIPAPADGGIDQFIEVVRSCSDDAALGGHIALGGSPAGDLDEFVVSVPIEISAPEDNILTPPIPDGLSHHG